MWALTEGVLTGTVILLKVKPVLVIGSQHRSSRVKLPGPHDAYVTLISVEAGAKTIHLDYEFPKSARAMVEKGRSLTVIAEVSIKPGMTLL